MVPIGQGDDALSYHIRLMRPEDIAQVTQIDREAFPTMIPPADYHSELKNRLARYIVLYDSNTPATTPPAATSPPNVFSLMIDGLRRWKRQTPGPTSRPSDNPYILGFAGIWIIAHEAHIINIAVRQSYRRHGIGELLLMALIELAREYQAGMITLEVRASNITSQQLYLKYHFQQVGRRKGYYNDNREDAILMSIADINSSSFQKRFRQLKRAHSQRWGVSLPRRQLTGWYQTEPDNG